MTVFPVPKFFESKVAVPLTVKTSPETRLSAYVTVAAVEALYTRLVAVMVTFSVRRVMSAVVVGAPVMLRR